MSARLLILCATEMEMAPFLEKNSGRSTFDLLMPGPGVFNTVHGLTRYLAQARGDGLPEFILHTGISGVFRQSGLGIHEVALADKSRYIHTGVDTGGPLPDSLPFDLIQNRPGTGRGEYAPDSTLARDCLNAVSNQLGRPVAKGLILTVSAITGTPQRADRLWDACTPLMEAMEGAAAFHTAALYNIPLVEIRAASNWVGDRDKANWDIPGAAQQVAHICEAVVNALC